MDKAVTIRTRKFMTNRLLSRKQFVSFPILFPLLLLCFQQRKLFFRVLDLDGENGPSRVEFIIYQFCIFSIFSQCLSMEKIGFFFLSLPNAFYFNRSNSRSLLLASVFFQLPKGR